jgi:glycosyltransferase involved in cell wall biosynthesis
VLRAFARVQAQYPDATLTLVGSGSQDATLRAQASALQLRNITFVGGVAPSDIHRYYSEADIYVQAPSIDNMPLSVLEAFASGMPVVSTGVGGVPSILRNGTDGLLVADNDDEALANAVFRLLNDPQFARSLAISARDTLAAYEWRVVCEEWWRVYRQVAARRRDDVAAQPVSAAPSNPA